MKQNHGNAYGPRFRPIGPHLLRVAALSASIAIAGCELEADSWAYWEHPNDPQVEMAALEKCLLSSSPPDATHYNDQDESLAECRSFAADVSRYCPDANPRCLPQYLRTRDDVRMILKEAPHEGASDNE